MGEGEPKFEEEKPKEELKEEDTLEGFQSLDRPTPPTNLDNKDFGEALKKEKEIREKLFGKRKKKRGK